MGLLGQGGIGRVVFDDESGPIALPVNFRMLADDVVFQTGDGSISAAIASGRTLSVEVDHFDDTLAEGWSVLVRGHAQVVTDPQEMRSIDQLHIESWAGQPQPTSARVICKEVTGRRIRRRL